MRWRRTAAEGSQAGRAGRALVLLLGFVFAVASAADAASRLMLTPQVVADLRAAEKTDPETARRLAELRHKADEILARPLMAQTFEVTYHAKPRTMLKVSRKMLKRVTVLGLAWQLWGEERYAARGRAELLAVAAFPDWNPAHFLDTAEMAAAVGLGIDWFSAYLSEADRARLVAAMVDKGLKPGLALYEGAAAWTRPRPGGFRHVSATEKADHGWPIETFNWNMVCNAALAIAALAVRPDEPAIADQVLNHSAGSIAHGFAEYGPDGGFPEGADYWSYATRYAAMFLHAADTALNDDFGHGGAPGFGTTGDFILYLIGPTGLAFNFADSETAPNLVGLAWLTGRYGRPVDSWLDRQASPGSRLALDLIWRVSDAGRTPLEAGLPTGRAFARVGVATFRTAWLDDKALFAGLKAGTNRGHHTHLDLGSFVLDGLGQRWASDLGPGNYGLPGYFGAERWRYYRTGTAGHNTLSFVGENQLVEAHAPLTAFHNAPGLSFVIADLGAAYGVADAGIRRGLAMLDGQRFVIQDEIGGDKPQAVRWAMHTRATVALDANAPATMTLRQGGETLAARIVAPAGARFALASATPPSPQQPNDGVSKVVIDLDAVASGTPRQLVVVLAPGRAAVAATMPVVPLAKWGSAPMR